MLKKHMKFQKEVVLSKGRNIINLLEMQKSEKVAALISVDQL